MKLLDTVCIIIAVLFFNFIIGQTKGDSCNVINDELLGQYTGQCKEGLAHGFGIFTFAEGKFSYKGYFKNGKMDGKGEMFSIVKGEKKLIRKGFWKDNVYVVESIPFVVERALNIDRYVVKKTGEGKRVNINFYQIGSRNNVSDLNIYVNNGNRIVGGNIESYEVTEFPFKCQVSYITRNKLNSTNYEVNFEITINEPGIWDITLNN